jgi:hypothetical protein
LSKRIDKINAKKLPEMSAATRDKLRRKFAPSAANLERMLDRNLNAWSV